MTTTQKDLYIYRGTKAEIEAMDIKDMAIYLAWDTQEIFVGNANGVAVPYGIDKSIFNRIDTALQTLEGKLTDKFVTYVGSQTEKEFKKSSDKIIGDLKTSITETIRASLLTQIDETLGKISNSINSLENSDRKNETTVSEIKDDINQLKDRLTDVEELNDVTNAAQTKISLLEDRTNSIFNRLLVVETQNVTDRDNANNLLHHKLDKSEFNEYKQLVSTIIDRVDRDINKTGSNSAKKSEFIEYKNSTDSLINILRGRVNDLESSVSVLSTDTISDLSYLKRLVNEIRSYNLDSLMTITNQNAQNIINLTNNLSNNYYNKTDVDLKVTALNSTISNTESKIPALLYSTDFSTNKSVNLAVNENGTYEWITARKTEYNANIKITNSYGRNSFIYDEINQMGGSLRVNVKVETDDFSNFNKLKLSGYGNTYEISSANENIDLDLPSNPSSSITFDLVGVPTNNDLRHISYNVTGDVGYKISIVAPVIFGNKRFYPEDGVYSTIITSGSKVLLFTPKAINEKKIKSNGFPIGFEKIKTSNGTVTMTGNQLTIGNIVTTTENDNTFSISITVDGVTKNYNMYGYRTTSAINDTTLEIEF